VLMEEEDALSCVTLARTVPAGGVMSLEYGEKAISRLCTVHPEGSHLPRVTVNNQLRLNIFSFLFFFSRKKKILF